MEETRYKVEMDGQIVARYMILADALILIKGLAEEYYETMKYGGKILLMEEERTSTEEREKVLNEVIKTLAKSEDTILSDKQYYTLKELNNEHSS